MGYPLSSREFGGGFLYTMGEGRVSTGLVVGLDYRDAALDPHERFQAFKSHPLIQEAIGGGRLLAYGAKAIPEGGYWAVPRCYFDGGMIVGDAAGFLNSMRLKGIHLAIKSGMIAAQTAASALAAGDCSRETLRRFEEDVGKSWMGDELWRVRNFHQGFRGGLWSGMAHAALQMATGGRGVRNRYPGEPGHTRMERRGEAAGPGERVAFDGVYTFDRLTDVHSSDTRHEEDQPVHLVVTAPETCYPKCTEEYGNPCRFFCPAAVYEMTPGQGGDGLRLEIHASNCVHCKACDIMDPYQVIEWETPEGGDGPDYRYL
jgi:electron-transferring-flavoprotein dehydrogenase